MNQRRLNRIKASVQRSLDLGRTQASTDWRPMVSAPKDGTSIRLRIRHANYYYAIRDEDKARWEDVVVAHWIDHNRGGWTWSGMLGVAVEWQPIEEKMNENELINVTLTRAEIDNTIIALEIFIDDRCLRNEGDEERAVIAKLQAALQEADNRGGNR